MDVMICNWLPSIQTEQALSFVSLPFDSFTEIFG